jgi:hypothetical protein
MQTAFPFEVKKLAESGEFEGLAAVYGNVDSIGDVIEAGAFARTLAASKERPLLFNHRDPVGIVELTDSSAGLIAKGKLSLGVQQAKDVYTLVRDRVVKGLSIGFETVKSDWRGEIRHLLEIKLWEVSLVTFPANPLATVTDVKSLDYSRVERALSEFKRDILAALERTS